MSPEQIMDRQTIDHRADIYSLGCVAYWCLTGSTVFAASDTTKLLRKHLEEQPQPLFEFPVCADLGVELNEVLMRCLAKDAAQRPQSAFDLANDLGKARLSGRWTQAKAIAWWQAHGTPCPDAT
jgi:serine/threonine-protein kinase